VYVRDPHTEELYPCVYVRDPHTDELYNVCVCPSSTHGGVVYVCVHDQEVVYVRTCVCVILYIVFQNLHVETYTSRVHSFIIDTRVLLASHIADRT